MSLGVPVTVLVVVGSTEAVKVFGGNPPDMLPVVAGFGLGVALYAIAALDNDLGHTFNTLVIIGALLINGQKVLDSYSKLITTKKAEGK